MFKKKSAVINENQNNKTHFLADFIVFYFKNVDFKNDNDVERIENK